MIMAQIFWGNKPSDHHPKISGVQFHFVIAVTDKPTAERFAENIRKEGSLARVQKKPLYSTFGNKRKVTSHCYVVFQAHAAKWRN